MCVRARTCARARVCVRIHMLWFFVPVQNLSGRKMPHIHPNPKFFPQFMNNWKLVRDEMQALGMKTMGIEPEGTFVLISCKTALSYILISIRQHVVCLMGL